MERDSALPGAWRQLCEGTVLHADLPLQRTPHFRPLFVSMLAGFLLEMKAALLGIRAGANVSEFLYLKYQSTIGLDWGLGSVYSEMIILN